MEQEYGPKAAERLHYLQDFIIENQYLSVMEQLEVVNSTLNRLPTLRDRKHWNREDYWATPLETITTFGGNCEDIAIVKWLVLNHLGVTNENLRLAYVKVKESGADHMVLIYVENPEDVTAGDVYVLDNLIPEVKAAYDRLDLLEVHLIDADGAM